MRRSRTEKDESRRQILAAAARLFRERGVDGVTVAEVMQAAKLTHGGFYRHFADKDDLVARAVASALEDGREGNAGSAGQNLAAFAASYLTEKHRDNAGSGCVFASLGPELARGSAPARHVTTEAIQRTIEAFAPTAPGRNDAERREAAIGTWAAMVGALVLSRLSDDRAFAQEVLDATHAWLTRQGLREGDGDVGVEPNPSGGG
ncbi:TetR/AcrR family transcriptional regulator [Xanthobacter dioxanivorans]|uniref:TetR/AcrR family transcriptional regulator n=1 Tax=Xanthobacter dioxanivorans TaxID=2528964 RepID=A0A974PLU9_9HYPH|nr:TetR/AcrR family transcriptional regulator [Xanthobacter dioxanivorans]QRG05569.1 TetR/AcrR family transcriptional regulator [Xanthobacter dioxanivorans]